jgi:hypothetical protein
MNNIPFVGSRSDSDLVSAEQPLVLGVEPHTVQRVVRCERCENSFCYVHPIAILVLAPFLPILRLLLPLLLLYEASEVEVGACTRVCEGMDGANHPLRLPVVVLLCVEETLTISVYVNAPSSPSSRPEKQGMRGLLELSSLPSSSADVEYTTSSESMTYP